MKTSTSFLLRNLRSFLLLLLTIISLSAFTQDVQQPASDLTQEQFIKGCAQYRSLIIHGVTDVYNNFNHLVDSLKSISEYLKGHEKVRAKVIDYMGVLDDVEDRDNYYNLFTTIGIDNKEQKIYRKWIKKNFNYLIEHSVLVSQDFIERNSPYKLQANTHLWEEVNGYHLRKGMTLVDIGTGIGHFPYIIALSGFEGTLYMTEIDSSLIAFLNNRKNQVLLKDIKADIHILEGKSKEAALGNIQADKIFFRETFHHLKHEKEILESIKKNIKPGGFVYVKEVVKDYVVNKKGQCLKIIPKEQIIQEFDCAGYRLVEEKRIGEYAILKFSL